MIPNTNPQLSVYSIPPNTDLPNTAYQKVFKKVIFDLSHK